jgi:RNA polymerase sigma-70 factor, ECF subfamily
VPRYRAPSMAMATSVPVVPDAGADDATLVAAARVDPAAYAFVYERYVERIHRYCYLKLGSRDAAEDATSQVFLEALDDLDRYRGGFFAGWLFRIAQHTVTDVHRQRTALSLDAAIQIRDPRRMPDQTAITNTELDTLRRALEGLPADQRAVMELQLADLSTREIAAALDRSANAVRIIRYRAFQRLRASMGAPALEGGQS